MVPLIPAPQRRCPVPGAHWLERLPVPSSAELSSGLGRAVGAEGCLGSVQACPQTRGAPRPRASPGGSSSPSSLPLASEAPSSGRVASLQLPCFLLLSWSSSRVGTFLCRFTVIFMRLGTERRQEYVVSAPHLPKVLRVLTVGVHLVFDCLRGWGSSAP